MSAPAVGPLSGLDPTALALLSIFGGVLLSALAGLFGAWLQSRREHHKWLREKRITAYSALIATYDKWSVLLAKHDGATPEDDDFLTEMIAAEAAVDLVGPASLEPHMRRVRRWLLTIDVAEPSEMKDRSDEYWKAQRAIVSAMQRVLGGLAR